MNTLGFPTFLTAGLLLALVLTSIVSIANHQMSRTISSSRHTMLDQSPSDVDRTAPTLEEPLHQKPVETVEMAANKEAFKIYLDASGKPTVPSHEQLAASQSAYRPDAAKSPVKKEPRIEMSPVKGGGEFARLDGRFRSASMATVNADGSIRLTHPPRQTSLMPEFQTVEPCITQSF